MRGNEKLLLNITIPIDRQKGLKTRECLELGHDASEALGTGPVPWGGPGPGRGEWRGG